MKLKIVLLSLLTTLAPQISHAISVSDLSDAISSSFSNATPAKTITPAAPAKTPRVAQTEKHLPNPALFIEDAAMTAYIHSQLLLKRNIPNVSVSTENAVVSLSGTVDTEEQANAIVKIASTVKGVRSVNKDNLIIRKKA
jgi:hyperosmotically inducible protein